MEKFNINIKSKSIPADLETPVSIYLKIRDMFPQSALLESSDYHTSQNSVSYIGVDPLAQFKVIDETIYCSYPDGTAYRKSITSEIKVAEELKEYIGSYNIMGEVSGNANGFFGYTAYDAVRYFEKVDVTKKDPCFKGIPDICYTLFRFVIKVNHYRNVMTIYQHIEPGRPDSIDEMIGYLRGGNIAQYSFQPVGDAVSTLTDEDFKDIVRKCIAHARRGDVFQIVPSRRFAQKFEGDEFNVYRALRSVNPSPYLFFFDFGAFRMFGSSPETHLKIEDGKAYIDPIAGTFRRTGDDEKDKELAQALLEDEKENAEHIMLVDLARNDLSRSGGKVEIDFFRQVQFYSHVIHLVSRVKATLPPEADIFELYAKTFPAGTLSGAPKVRAMQIIDELEPSARMTYGGCIGFIGFSGNLNQAITIRSFLSYGNTLYSQAGAGIVAHSDPEMELRETNNKLGALVSALKVAESYGKPL